MTVAGRFAAISGAEGNVIDAARDLMLAGEMLRETIGWADGQVAELEARWARNRAARRQPADGIRK